jgi:hypothetical protein
MVERWGHILYRVGSIAAMFGFLCGGMVVARPGPNAALWLWALIGTSMATWLLGRIALYVLAKR